MIGRTARAKINCVCSNTIRINSQFDFKEPRCIPAINVDRCGHVTKSR